MSDLGGFGALGDVMQIGFMPDDFDAAIKYWTDVMGVGPFFFFEGAHLNGMTYRGEPTEAAFDVAMSYWGDLQIELLRARDTHPSIYTGEYANVGGVHHFGVIIDNIQDAYRLCREQSAEILIEGTLGDNQILFVDPGGGPGHLVGFTQQCDNGPVFFNKVKEAVRTWDGSEPIRAWG